VQTEADTVTSIWIAGEGQGTCLILNGADKAASPLSPSAKRSGRSFEAGNYEVRI